MPEKVDPVAAVDAALREHKGPLWRNHVEEIAARCSVPTKLIYDRWQVQHSEQRASGKRGGIIFGALVLAALVAFIVAALWFAFRDPDAGKTRLEKDAETLCEGAGGCD